MEPSRKKQFVKNYTVLLATKSHAYGVLNYEKQSKATPTLKLRRARQGTRINRA